MEKFSFQENEMQEHFIVGMNMYTNFSFCSQNEQLPLTLCISAKLTYYELIQFQANAITVVLKVNSQKLYSNEDSIQVLLLRTKKKKKSALS